MFTLAFFVVVATLVRPVCLKKAMMMKLYYTPGSCSLSVHIALHEAALPFSLCKVNLRAQPHTTEDGTLFSSINPKGYVPALQLDNGELLTEGPALVQYVADLAPEKQLAPTNGTLARYRLQESLNFIATEIHKPFGPLWNAKASAEAKEAAWQQLSRRFDELNTHFSQQDWLLPQYSVADGYLFSCLNWTRFLHLSLEKWPALETFMQRITARPAVQAALQAEGLLG